MRKYLHKKVHATGSNWVEINLNNQDKVELDRSISLTGCEEDNKTGHEIPVKDRLKDLSV